MSLKEINKLASSILKMAEDSEKVLLPSFTVKLEKVAEANPHDKTVGGMLNVLSKMEDNKKMFITKGELKSLYNKLYTVNTKFAEHFADELGTVTELKGPTFAPKHEAMLSDNSETFVDPILSNALNSVFDSSLPFKAYSAEMAEKAKTAVNSNLDMWNFKPSKLEVKAGNEHFIVITADYNTPKGVTSVFVPVELNKNVALDPAIFMCNAGPQELNHNNLKNYLLSSAGSKLKVRAEDILNILTSNVTGEGVSTVELAATKLAARKESSGDFGQILGQSLVEPTRAEVSVPKSVEADSFAARLSSTVGEASLHFGQDKVNLGKELVIRTLAGFGFRKPQLTVLSYDKDTCFYGVSLENNKTAFKVPVKMSGKVNVPEFIICNGSVSEFTKDSINNLLIDETTDSKVAAVTSTQYGLKASELVDNVKAAMKEGNYAKAEDALNILQETDEVAYKAAFSYYLNGMSMEKVAEVKSTCSMVIKTAHSSHPVCGHTNLPLHKVYQDQYGECHPNYRKGMEESYQGAFFNNYKIFG